MSNTIKMAIEVSRYLRRVTKLLFEAGAGVHIDNLLLEEDNIDTGTGIIDAFAADTVEWDWMNSVLMLLRTINGILEDAENSITEE